MIGKITKIQEKTTKEGDKKFLLITINGEIVSTFFNLDYIKATFKEGDDIEYEYSVKGDYKNLKSIKKLDSAELPKQSSKDVSKIGIKNLNSKLNTEAILEDSFREVIRVTEKIAAENPKKEQLQYSVAGEFVELVTAVFNAKVYAFKTQTEVKT